MADTMAASGQPPLPAVRGHARVLRAAIFKAANLMIAITVAGAYHD
jgi:hypothetical protein